jgi:DNA-binding PadR family transcriptional regulator
MAKEVIYMGTQTELVKGTTAPICLRLLAEREMYGYEMVKAVNERTNGALQWKEGTLYPCLHQLEADGLVHSIWRSAPSSKMRKYYRLTRKGHAELTRRVEEWRTVHTAVNAVLLEAV